MTEAPARSVKDLTLVLSNSEIRDRLNSGEIFRDGTWDEKGIKEASYALRVAPDGMRVNDVRCPPGQNYDQPQITIEPGRIAILSTQERLNMPADLVGQPGIRFDFAARGLTGLMGIQVDPYYGSDHDDERLYLRVANLGNEPVVFRPGDLVFNIEFKRLDVAVEQPIQERPLMWDRIDDLLKTQKQSGWSYLTQLKAESEHQKELWDKAVDNVRQGLQPVVMFGIFLVATTLLGVVLAFFLGLRDTPTAKVPSWFTDFGWITLTIVIGIAALMTILIGLATAIKAFKNDR